MSVVLSQLHQELQNELTTTNLLLNQISMELNEIKTLTSPGGKFESKVVLPLEHSGPPLLEMGLPEYLENLAYTRWPGGLNSTILESLAKMVNIDFTEQQMETDDS